MFVIYYRENWTFPPTACLRFFNHLFQGLHHLASDSGLELLSESRQFQQQPYDGLAESRLEAATGEIVQAVLLVVLVVTVEHETQACPNLVT